MVAGAMVYVLIADQSLGLAATGHRLQVAVAVAVASALCELPKVYGRLKDRQEPLTIRFSRAFGAGLRAPLSLLPNLSKWTAKVQGFWCGLRQGAGV